MTETRRTDAPLLKLIPPDEMTAVQKAFQKNCWFEKYTMHELLREPIELNELEWHIDRMVLWRKSNETFICVGGSPRWEHLERHVNFTIHDEGIKFKCIIYGHTDAAVAETATFFLVSQHPGTTDKNCIEICDFLYSRCNFDFAALSPEQLAQILHANPARAINLRTGIWTTEQCVTLATRPYLLNLTLDVSKCSLQDDGTSFVSALENRKASFGSLRMDCEGFKNPCFSTANLRQLLKVGIFEKLTIPGLRCDLDLLPFSAAAKELECTVSSFKDRDELSNMFNSLDIRPTNLSLNILVVDDFDGWVEALISLLDRMAELGHFERLELSFEKTYLEWFGRRSPRQRPEPRDSAPAIAEALIRAIHGNPELMHLDVSQIPESLGAHLPDIFKCIEDHKSLQTIAVHDDLHFESL